MNLKSQVHNVFYPLEAKAAMHITSVNRFGMVVTFDDDNSFHYLSRDQRWLPHAVEGMPNKFAPDDMLYTPLSTLPAIVFVSRVRRFQYHRFSFPVDQVELVGMPFKWWAVGHFE